MGNSQNFSSKYMWFCTLAFRMLIAFLNDLDIGCSLEFKTVLENMTQPFLKILKGTFLEAPFSYAFSTFDFSS